MYRLFSYIYDNSQCKEKQVNGHESKFLRNSQFVDHKHLLPEEYPHENQSFQYETVEKVQTCMRNEAKIAHIVKIVTIILVLNVHNSTYKKGYNYYRQI